MPLTGVHKEDEEEVEVLLNAADDGIYAAHTRGGLA